MGHELSRNLSLNENVLHLKHKLLVEKGKEEKTVH